MLEMTFQFVTWSSIGASHHIYCEHTPPSPRPLGPRVSIQYLFSIQKFNLTTKRSVIKLLLIGFNWPNFLVSLSNPIEQNNSVSLGLLTEQIIPFLQCYTIKILSIHSTCKSSFEQYLGIFLYFTDCADICVLNII